MTDCTRLCERSGALLRHRHSCESRRVATEIRSGILVPAKGATALARSFCAYLYQSWGWTDVTVAPGFTSTTRGSCEGHFASRPHVTNSE